MRILSLALAALGAVPGNGQVAAPPDVPRVEAVRLDLSNFRVAPRRLTLVRGRAYVIELVNRSASGHDFTARGLLGSSRVSGAAAAGLAKGSIDVPAGSRVRIAIVPLKPGGFEFHCGHPLHAALGMRGRIDVL